MQFFVNISLSTFLQCNIQSISNVPDAKERSLSSSKVMWQKRKTVAGVILSLKHLLQSGEVVHGFGYVTFPTNPFVLLICLPRKKIVFDEEKSSGFFGFVPFSLFAGLLPRPWKNLADWMCWYLSKVIGLQ